MNRHAYTYVIAVARQPADLERTRKNFLKRSLNCFTQTSKEGGRKLFPFDHLQIRDKSPTLVGDI